MVRNFDHVTIVVRDVEAAKRFCALLGFTQTKSVVISGKIMEDYMGVAGIEAEHVTLALDNVSPRTEVQLLRYHHPDVIADPSIAMRNKVMQFHSRKLVFVYGPEDITVELAEWH